MFRRVLIGMIAGAAGTAALNIVTNVDMVVRARPASSVPATVAGELSGLARIDSLSARNDDESVQNRQSGAGALLGFVTGLGIGAIYGLLQPKIRGVPVGATGAGLGVAAMLASDVPAAALNVSDPKSWGANEWLSDLVPHLIYGVVTATVYDALTRR